METTEFKTEIALLESQFDHYNDLLARAIDKNVKFSVTRIIYCKLREVSDKLKKIRGLWGSPVNIDQ